MIRRCELTETAAKLSLHLEAYRIPDDFDASGDDAQVIGRIRDDYTNYKKLLNMLPPCPDDCPATDTASSTNGRHCLTYEFARHMLRTEARQLACQAYNAWRNRRKAYGIDAVRTATARE